MKRRIEQYFERVELLTGGGGQLEGLDPENGEDAVSIIEYRDLPEQGDFTTFSFGISSLNRPEWKESRPELLISVQSDDSAWGFCMGEIIRLHRHKCLFAYGDILHFGQVISDSSPMTSFLVFACSLLDKENVVMKLDDRTIHFSQLYPVHASEADVIKRIGAERFFFDLGINFSNTKRSPVS